MQELVSKLGEQPADIRMSDIEAGFLSRMGPREVPFEPHGGSVGLKGADDRILMSAMTGRVYHSSGGQKENLSDRVGSMMAAFSSGVAGEAAPCVPRAWQRSKLQMMLRLRADDIDGLIPESSHDLGMSEFE